MSEIKKVWANYDTETGKYIGFYAYHRSGSVPTPFIELTEEQHANACFHPQGYYRVISGSHTLYTNTEEEQAAIDLKKIRQSRDLLLTKSDWVVLPHSPITGSKLDEWIEYRQDLRDVTSQTRPYTLPTQPE